MSLISNKELKDKIGASQERQVIKWLNENRIKWWKDAQKRAITTIGEIERSQKTDEEVSF